MVIKRYSKQRECILIYLKSVKSHPTVETIFFEVKKKIPSISLGTVYRNLNQLTSDGEVLRLITDSGAEHFDGNVIPHCHIVCNKCGKVEDVDVSLNTLISGTIENVSYQTKYKNLFPVLHFYGVCPACDEHS